MNFHWLTSKGKKVRLMYVQFRGIPVPFGREVVVELAPARVELGPGRGGPLLELLGHVWVCGQLLLLLFQMSL